MLDRLWNSTENLHKRFGTHQTVAQAVACFREELAEVEAATTQAEITEECVDVIVTLMGIMMAKGVLRVGNLNTEWGDVRKTSRWSNTEQCLASIRENFIPLLGMSPLWAIRDTLRIMQLSGVTYQEFNKAVKRVIAKNDAKTHETHRVNSDGKIQRIGRV